jgi:lipoprotein-releasing system permease protein
MLKGKSSNKKISRPIVSLAIIGITLGIAVMLLSVSIATGFQKEIRDKVIGFGSHIQITSEFGNLSFESYPMLADQSFLTDIANEDKVNHIQNFAYKPAIIQTRGDQKKEIQGVIFKGITQDFDPSFFQKNLVKGKMPIYTNETINDSILISSYVAKKLTLELNEKVTTYFVKEAGPKQRSLIIAGIYETGMEDFDKQFAIIDINHIRKLNNWGITTNLFLKDECSHGFPVIEAQVVGGNENYRYSWNGGSYSDEYEIILCPIKDTTIMLTTTDFESYSYLDEPEPNSVPDTAWLSIKVDSTFSCDCSSSDMKIDFDVVDESSLKYNFNGNTITTTLKTAGGSAKYYTGGFEILLKDYNDLFAANDLIEKYTTREFSVSTITERNEEIFNWLNMLDLNVYIIIGLMILVAIINMTSALLVIILERTQMIGILKALVQGNWSIRKIFLYNGGYLITKGMLYGNILAIGIIVLQNQFHVLTLPQANYYVSVVPMSFPVTAIVLVDVCAFVICFMALVLPSYMITRISPVKAIKFE